jgi:hypothetical protein
MAETEVDQIGQRPLAVEATPSRTSAWNPPQDVYENQIAVRRFPATDAQRLRAGVGEDHLGELETKRRMRSNGVRPVVKVLFRARAAN